MEEITFMALSDTFTTLGNTIINLVNSRTAHKQNQLVAGDGIQITENSEEKNADICIHPDIEAAFQSVIDEIEAELPPTVLLLESIASGGSIPPEKPFIVSTNLTEIPDYTNEDALYKEILKDNTYVISADLSSLQSLGDNGLSYAFRNCTNLTTVNLSNATSIGDSGLNTAFRGCINLTSVDLSSVTSIGNNGLYYAFYLCEGLTSTGLNNVTSIDNGGLSWAFFGCTNLTSTGLDNVTIIGSSSLTRAFYSCTNLTSTGLNNVTSIGNNGLCYAFYSCTNLTSTGLNNVTSIGNDGLNSAFYGCRNLTSTGLNNVTSIGGYGLRWAFQGCTSLTSLSFPALNSNSFGRYTNQFDSMLEGVTACTVHFPSNLESVIGSWSDVLDGFGGTNTTVLFDLPATT